MCNADTKLNYLKIINTFVVFTLINDSISIRQLVRGTKSGKLYLVWAFSSVTSHVPL